MKKCKRLKDIKAVLDVYEKAYGNILLSKEISLVIKKENNVIVLEFEEENG